VNRKRVGAIFRGVHLRENEQSQERRTCGKRKRIWGKARIGERKKSQSVGRTRKNPHPLSQKELGGPRRERLRSEGVVQVRKNAGGVICWRKLRGVK